MSLTDEPVAIADAIVALLQADVSLGLQDVFWGDQDMIPRSPAATVEPATLTQSLYATGAQTENQFLTYIMVYHSKVEDTSTTQRECALYAQAIRKSINTDFSLGGILTFGFVRQLEVGYALRNKVFLRSARISYVGKSYTRLH